MQPPPDLAAMIKTFRRECLRVRKSERTTVHGADEMVLVLQLAMAEVNKRHYGDFTVSLSDVLIAWKKLIFQKLQIPAASAPLENYNEILEEYESFLKRSNTVDLLDVFSLYKDMKTDSDPKVSLNTTQLCEYLLGNTKVAEAEETPAPSTQSTPSSTQRDCSSQVKRAVRRVFCSYLSLLVNSKNDLAMALTLDVPNRNLGRDAFTCVKHTAREDNTSLFLAVTSFVRAIQLGGKGYAPAESSPLRKHLKGLSDFVQFIDNLEDILGEIPEPSVCCTKLVSAIRALIVKGRPSADPVFVAADRTAKEIKEKICELNQNQKTSTNDSMEGISPARPKAYAINHATALGGRDTVKLLLALLDEEALTPPAPNKAELLSEDQPILNGEESVCLLTLFRSPEVSSGSSPLPLSNRVQSRLELLKPKVKDKVIRSQFACTYTDEELPLNRVLEFPSSSQVPTCVHPAPKPRWTTVEEEATPTSDNTGLPDVSTSDRSDPESQSSEKPAALVKRSGNSQNRAVQPGNERKTGKNVQTKANKRKPAEGDQTGGAENEPPKKKKPQTTVKNVSKTQSKKKLIDGQGKLTNFFRL